MSNIANSKRNVDGLIDGITYPVDENGFINWQGMFKPEHCYPKDAKAKEEIETRFNKNFNKLTEEELFKVSPRQYLVTLAGINYLAWLRGIKSSIPQSPIVTQNEVTSVWVVEFIPNCEDVTGITVAGQASASLYSVSGAFQLHLAALAGNRAYIRAVRQALRIESLGKDEFDPEASAAYTQALKDGKTPVEILSTPPKTSDSSHSVATITPQQTLAKRCGELGYTLAQIKGSASKIRAEMVSNPESAKICRINGDPAIWNEFNDIQPLDCMTLLDKMNTAASKKSKK